MKKFLSIILIGLLINISCKVSHENITLNEPDIETNRFSNITLEMSLKPFKKNDKGYISSVCHEIYTQWSSLLRHADTVKLFLYVSEGSDILEYSGNLDQPIEWARYLGNPNTKWEVNSEPDKNLSLHERAFTYMDNPPSFTYRDVKHIVSEFKRVGNQMTGKPILAGVLFDPGPEFAKSEFKYKKHPEICMASTMGEKSFLCCYATLNEDSDSYAGFPDGIPQGLPLGTFLGRQSQHYLADLGFDYIWFSNGFGFGMETWSATGALFDGKDFHPEKFQEIRKKILNFWDLFRKECPDFRIETRGTNLATGIDLAADGVDLRSIYRGGYNILPPPNSPWAALDGDFGLELAGYMSRIVELPDYRYLFRYYTHDPWWLNSPWLDRYGREPHDIYLPMAISRIDKNGEVRIPTHLDVMGIDNSYGEMPVQVSDEVTPHILQARRKAPDQPGLVVWVYPFDEYHDWIADQPERIEEIYFGDWYIRQAINEGFPLNTVISTKNFSTIQESGKSVFEQSVLVSVVPSPGSEYEKNLIDFTRKGGKLIIYGPVTHASKEFLELLNIKTVEPLPGDFLIKQYTHNASLMKNVPSKLRHSEKMSGGGIETIISTLSSDTKILAQVFQNQERRDVAVFRKNPNWNGGAVCYIRGTNSASYKGGRLLTPDDPEVWFSGNILMRECLAEFGYSISYEKKSPGIKDPVNCISRHNNAYWFSGYVPNQTVEQRFHFPQGAPIFVGWETEIKDGVASYRFPKAFFEECRIFVEQADGIVSCREMISNEKGITRRIGVSGLKDATVRFYLPHGINPQNVKTYLNAGYPYKKGEIASREGTKYPGEYVVYKNITGSLILSW